MTPQEYFDLHPNIFKNCEYVLKQLKTLNYSECAREYYTCLPDRCYKCVKSGVFSSYIEEKNVIGTISYMHAFIAAAFMDANELDGIDMETEAERIVELFFTLCKYFIILNIFCDKSATDTAGKMLAGLSINARGFIGYNTYEPEEDELDVPMTTPYPHELSTLLYLGNINKNIHDYAIVDIFVKIQELISFQTFNNIAELPVEVCLSECSKYSRLDEDGRLVFEQKVKAPKRVPCKLGDLRNAMLRQILEVQK